MTKKDETAQTNESLSINKPDAQLMPKFDNIMRLAILNAPIITTPGNYTCVPIPLESARILVNSMEITSHVGHESTAELLSVLLEHPIKFSRKELRQRVGQMALVFTLNHRAKEGEVLSKKLLEEIGFQFMILYRKN